MENGIDDPSVSMETKPRGFLRREEDLAVQALDVDNDNKRTRIQTILLLEDDLPAILIEEVKTLKNAFLLRSRINFVVSSWTSLGRSRFEFTFLLLLPEAKKKIDVRENQNPSIVLVDQRMKIHQTGLATKVPVFFIANPGTNHGWFTPLNTRIHERKRLRT